tara:strand:- start:1073 stop:1966 length:894 start_codon:yes stop_codon:yes gene_type:complete
MKKTDLNCPVCEKFTGNKVIYQDTLENEIPEIGYDYLNKNFDKTYQYLQCKDCEHVYASPIFLGIEGSYQETEDPIYLRNSSYRKKAYEIICKMIKKKFPNKEKLLDFGCATGDFLEVAKNHFPSSEGVEISKFYYDIASKKGLNVHLGSTEVLKLQKKKYDIVTLWGVIEHLQNPAKIIREIREIISEGGVLILWTGDYNSIYSKILKKNWWYVIGQHIQLFSHESLVKLFSKNGYLHLEKKYYPYVFSNRYIDFHLRRYSIYKYFFRIFILPLLVIKFHFTLRLSSELLLIFKKK